MLRDSFIDWGTFLEIYHDNLDYSIMFDQVMKLLNVKENENLRDVMIPIVKKIYHLPADAHLSCMMKQFMIFEPVAIAIHSLFTLLKQHFEHIVEKFVVARNAYLINNELDKKVKLNDWEKLLKEWSDINTQYNIDTSSLVLYFLNPPKHIKSGLHYKIPGKEDLIDRLKMSTQKYHYDGFCPKAAHDRLISLLKFPINEFVDTIKNLDKNAIFPDYRKIEKEASVILSNKMAKPKIEDHLPREKPPIELTKAIKDNEKINKDSTREKLHLVQWYVTKILELRKQLINAGKEYEEYYIDSAKTINEVKDMISRELHNVKL